MRLNRSTDYAIRMLIYLAKASGAVSSSQLARTIGVSPRYLLQIGAKLREAGMIETTYGPNGGLVLVKPAHEISLYDIVTVMEGKSVISKAHEITTTFESLHAAYGNVEETWVRSLKEVTIASLL